MKILSRLPLVSRFYGSYGQAIARRRIWFTEFPLLVSRIYSIYSLHAGTTLVNLIAAVFLAFCANGKFWHVFISRIGLNSTEHWAFTLGVGLSLILLFNIILSIFSFPPLYKPLIILILCISAVVSYFTTNFGIIIDKAMFQSVLDTDAREASELLTWGLFQHLLLLALIPSLVLLKTKIVYKPWRKELLIRLSVVLASATLLGAVILFNFKGFALFGRENKDLRMYINPTYPIYAATKVISTNYAAKHKEPRIILAADARKGVETKRSVVVFVVGETARAQEFSLNGYMRATNPKLSQRDIFNFADVQSCGTDTATSVPCMFSHLEKENYSRSEAKKYDNLLDIVQRTGVQVLWRDNNSGSKGVSDRVPTENLADAKDAEFCSSGECYDEILLKGLDTLLAKNMGDLLIILHQKGSHGPSYYKRTPPQFKKFLPECTQDNVQDCDPRTIVNAYDNTIVYTDYVLSKLIDILQSQKYPAAMLYVSDHGESLGENNIYLHGLPYSFAPESQTHVPMVFWASKSFFKEKGINFDIVAQHKNDSLTHDNIFHTILGLFGIQSAIYRHDLDMFANARSPNTQAQTAPVQAQQKTEGPKG